MRDEFSEETKRAVAARVGNVCSNPGCRALTSGPQIDPTKSLNVGVAAHITAASPGGPRFDPSLSPGERRHANNAIWLCQTCAKLVDNDPDRYSAYELRKWKNEAEAAALSQVGRIATLPSPVVGELSRLAESKAIVRIRPIIPAKHEADNFQLQEAEGDIVRACKCSSQHHIEIPTRRVADLLAACGGEPPTILIDGRLQWLTSPRIWRFFEAKPDPALPFGFSKPSSLNDQAANMIIEQYQRRGRVFGWVYYREVSARIGEGWQIVYDDDGRYFGIADRRDDLVLMVKPV